MNKRSPTGIEDPPGTNSVTATLPKFSCVGVRGRFGYESCKTSVTVMKRHAQRYRHNPLSLRWIISRSEWELKLCVVVPNIHDSVPRESRKSNPDLRHHHRGFWAIKAVNNGTCARGKNSTSARAILLLTVIANVKHLPAYGAPGRETQGRQWGCACPEWGSGRYRRRWVQPEYSQTLPV